MAANTAEGASSISVLGTDQQEAWRNKTLPRAERLTEGIWSIPVPIPDNPLRYTLSYLVPGDDGAVVVDPGWDTSEGWNTLLAGMAQAGVGLGDIAGVVATHVHPDHHGLSGRLRESSGAWVAMHPVERDTLPQRSANGERANGERANGERANGERANGDRSTMARGWLRRCGAPEDDIAALVDPFDAGAPPARGPGILVQPDVLLDDGDLVPLRGRKLRAVWTPGHTPGHLCLQEPDAKVLLTGDHVLPRITPNIGIQPMSTDSPLSMFLDSLDRVARYDDHDALPAHEYRFRGLATRARQLREHHHERCREILGVVAELGDPTLWQVAEHLSWARPWAEIGAMRFGALSETAAHVDHLAGRDELAWHGYHADGGENLVRVRQPATATL